MPVSVKTGDVGPASMGLDDCAKLDSANENARDELIENLSVKYETNRGKNPDGKLLLEPEYKVLDQATTTGMTFSSAAVNIDNTRNSYTACSSGMAREKVPGVVCGGGTSAQMNGHGDEPGVLCDKSYTHSRGGFGAHAEAKIVNEATGVVGPEKMKGGSMLFSIDWRSAEYGNSGMPCPLCFKMLCHAAKECDIRIFICSHDNKHVVLSKDDCEEDTAYKKLCRAVDGGDRPGRK
jgi:hypothetical protein